MDKEFLLQFFIVNEQEGVEAGMMHSINGKVFGQLDGLEMTVGDRVRWHFMGMGNELDIHTAHWCGARAGRSRAGAGMLEPRASPPPPLPPLPALWVPMPPPLSPECSRPSPGPSLGQAANSPRRAPPLLSHCRHGMTMMIGGDTTDMAILLPGTMTSGNMLADNPGKWPIHCHVADHLYSGMYVTYTIKKADGTYPEANAAGEAGLTMPTLSSGDAT